MEIIDAIKVVSLMKSRDGLLDMHTDCKIGSQMGWSFIINDKKYPIPNEVKKFFNEAVAKAIEYFETEIEKL